MIFGIILVLPLVSSISEQLPTPCFGDFDLSVSCTPSNFQIFYFGKEFVAPVVTLIAPVNNSEDSDRILEVYYNVSDDNQVDNCSLFLDWKYQTSNTSIVENTQLMFRVQHPPVKERLSWIISCTDNFNNNGNSSTWYIKTRRGGASELGGGLGGFLVNISELTVGDLNVTEEIIVPERKRFPFIIVLIFIIGGMGILVYERRKKLITLFLLLEDKGKEFLEKLKKESN